MSKIKKHCQNFMICIVLHNLSFACFFVFAKDMNKNFFAHVMKMMKAVLAEETFFSDNTLPIAKILSAKNARAWVSMVFT